MADPTARRRWHIDVTPADIERAHRNDSYTCVVAQALARTIPDSRRIEVDTQTIRFTIATGERLVYLTPYAVQGYVVAFDAGEEVHPFTFRLERPMAVRKFRKTEAGKVADKAATRARRLTSRTAVDAPRKAGQDVSPAEAYAAVRQTTPGPLYEQSTGRKAPRRVFRTKARTYGHRVLRINAEA